MRNFKAKVKVNLKPEIKDIKAITLENAVASLMDVNKLKCRVGSFYSIDFEAEDEDAAQKIVQTIADEILSNSVIEEYEVIWEK